VVLIHQRHRRTDRRHAIALHYSASRGRKKREMTNWCMAVDVGMWQMTRVRRRRNSQSW